MMEALATARGLALRGPGGTVFLSNKQLAAVADFAIALQDLIQPDPDLEENGLEDSFQAHALKGPGCPIADPGGGNVEDEGEQEGGV